MWLIWDKFSVSTSSDTETASQVQATDHEIDEVEIECEPSAPTNTDFEEEYRYCNDISNVANEISSAKAGPEEIPIGNNRKYDIP